MKYRRLKLRWTRGRAIGTVYGWLGKTLFSAIAVADHGPHGWYWVVPDGGFELIGFARTEMGARVAAVKELRKCLGLIDCREGWVRTRDGGYNYGHLPGPWAHIHRSQGGLYCLSMQHNGKATSACGFSCEDLAAAAEKALVVRQ